MPIHDVQVHDALSPVSETSDRSPEPGIALCLSGGGYRAMVFHLGSLWRLNELGYLSRLSRISSVSGGSITAGLLGLKWNRLQFVGGIAQRLGPEVIEPLPRVCTRDDRCRIGVKGHLPPRLDQREGGWRVSQAPVWRRNLAGSARRSAASFAIDATNVQTGSLWRFSKPYMRDYQVGEVKSPTVPLAMAVAASSAFPPARCGELEIESGTVQSGASGEPYHVAPYTSKGDPSDGAGCTTTSAWRRPGNATNDPGRAMPGWRWPRILDPGGDWASYAIARSTD